MTGRNGSQKKGLFAGFLSGTAMCLCLGAAAAYISPVDGKQAQEQEPAVETTEVTPAAPKNEASNVAVITPRSDTARIKVTTPGNESPAEDRDNANVAASVREATDPVQTDTSDLETPQPIDGSDTQTVAAEDVAPQEPVVTPLATLETVPEESAADIDVSTGSVAAKAPELEVSDVESPEEDEPVTLALNAPKVDVPETAPEAIELGLASKPDVTPAPKPETVEEEPALVARPTPVLPKARPEIALNQPTATVPKSTAPSATVDQPEVTSIAPSETDQVNEPVLALPDTDETVPTTPQTDVQSEDAPTAPIQVETPTIDAEPEAPVIEQASVVPDVVEEKTPEPEVETQPEAEVQAPETLDEEVKAAEGEETPKPEAEAETAAADRRNPPPPSFDGRAFDAFAVKFIPPNNKPFLTVVLEHVGEGSVDMYDLLNFGQPITFAVSSADDLAKFRENEFRKAGFEVVALVPEQPANGFSQDMDEASVSERIESFLEAVPGAVAVMDQTESDLYRAPRMVSRVSNELKRSGRGLLVHEKFGINRALEAARSSGIPAASMVRIIDEQRDAASIRRALDRASLDASKTGAAIVFGRTYPETVAAILPWLLGNSARSVTLAPLTSTMKRMVE